MRYLKNKFTNKVILIFSDELYSEEISNNIAKAFHETWSDLNLICYFHFYVFIYLFFYLFIFILFYFFSRIWYHSSYFIISKLNWILQIFQIYYDHVCYFKKTGDKKSLSSLLQPEVAFGIVWQTLNAERYHFRLSWQAHAHSTSSFPLTESLQGRCLRVQH